MNATRVYAAVADTFSEGGCTFSLSKPVPESGYMVSVGGTEVRIPVPDFNQEALDRFVAAHMTEAEHLGLYFGTWLDNGTVYVDLSMHIADETEALLAGQLENQLAIFDIANLAEIRL